MDISALITKINVFPSSPQGQRIANLCLGWAWFAFGIVGLIDYLWGTEVIAQSIPVLFFISVYANFTGHLSTAQAARVEVKAEEMNVTTNNYEK